MSSERFQILDRPTALPGKCVICGFAGGENSDGRKFVDFGFDLDFYGAVIFCENCFVSGQNTLGWLSPDQALKLKFVAQENEEKLQRALSENAKLRSALDSLHFLGDSTADIPVDTNAGTQETAKSERPANNGSSKSPNKRGSKNLSNNDEVDPILGI